MTPCGSFRRLLPGYEAGDLTPREHEFVEEHLDACFPCAEEHRKFQMVIISVRRTYDEEYQLSPEVRNRIAVQAAEKVGSAPWFFPIGLLYPVTRPRFVLAIAAALAVVLSLPVVTRLASRPKPGEEVARVEVSADHGVVRLAWANGRRESYTVYKSHDPQGQSSRKAYVVRGNVWTDTEPDSSPVVFYRID
jgi:anti-sigma factor RsiW